MSPKSKILRNAKMTRHQKNQHGELLMICGALHDIAELLGSHKPFPVSLENVSGHIKICEQRLEKITLAQIKRHQSRTTTRKLLPAV